MSQGFFESDDDYRERTSREADERTIEDSTGSAPSKGWLESDSEYRDRISQEAHERTVEDSTGSAPSKGWLESDDDYRDRISQEADERTVEDSTGSAPSKGWLEGDKDYETRIRREANEHTIERHSGNAPKQGWFEGNHDYRSRIAHEARELKARERADSSTYSHSSSSSNYDGNSGYSPSGSSGIIAVFLVIAIGAGVLMFNGTEYWNRGAEFAKTFVPPQFRTRPRTKVWYGTQNELWLHPQLFSKVVVTDSKATFIRVLGHGTVTYDMTLVNGVSAGDGAWIGQNGQKGGWKFDEGQAQGPDGYYIDAWASYPMLDTKHYMVHIYPVSEQK